jgi:hypothetical protein
MKGGEESACGADPCDAVHEIGDGGRDHFGFIGVFVLSFECSVSSIGGGAGVLGRFGHGSADNLYTSRAAFCGSMNRRRKLTTNGHPFTQMG